MDSTLGQLADIATPPWSKSSSVATAG